MGFVLFPKLPPEIRGKIWLEAARAQSRIVEVHWASGDGFTFHTYPPALLSVSFESRALTYPLFHDTYISRLESKAPFCFERDILYFPYRSQCSTTYGMALEAFLTRLDDRMKLRHLALSIPSPEAHLQGPLPVRGGFFTRVQGKARRACELSLETVTLVIDDPIMQTPQPEPITQPVWPIQKLYQNHRSRTANSMDQEGQSTFMVTDTTTLKNKTEWEIGVAQDFKALLLSDEKEKERWNNFVLYFTRVLKEPHDAWNFPYPQHMHARRIYNSWGDRCQLFVRNAGRKPGNWAVGTSSMKPYWLRAHRMILEGRV